MGIPGTSCATCLETAHGYALRVAQGCVRDFRGTPLGSTAQFHEERARAAWAGCNVLLDCLGTIFYPSGVSMLVRVGFEVPSMARSHGQEASQ